MKNPICAALLVVACWGLLPVFPVTAAVPKTSVVAVVLLGSPEFQDFEYYEITTESLSKKLPADQYNLAVGHPSQQMFNRFSDKQGLWPGNIPPEEILAKFARAHAFDEVIFIMLTAPVIRSSDITIQWEKAEVKITARALRYESHSGKKLIDATSTQTVKWIGRTAAKKAAFRKCLEELREHL
jgi:hypothetical protein